MKQILLIVHLIGFVLATVQSSPTKEDEVLDSLNIQAIDPSERVVYSGSPPAAAYPFGDFVSYAPNCDFNGNDLYAISGVADFLRCGSQFCYGDRRCTHFAYRASDGYCAIKSRAGFGSAGWASSADGIFCGMIPKRACNVNLGSISSILGCLSLTI